MSSRPKLTRLSVATLAAGAATLVLAVGVSKEMRVASVVLLRVDTLDCCEASDPVCVCGQRAAKRTEQREGESFELCLKQSECSTTKTKRLSTSRQGRCAPRVCATVSECLGEQ